ncbi:MAG: murein biosynthesis integral membrane protein MurJ [Ardenticatenaceae bacterium]|nr:murein biosynthesis integral membrane protein MurJ [Ardenticatenaceae bacterium]
MTQITPAEEESSSTIREPNNGVVRAAAVLAVGNVASRILGLARETVKANLFGPSGLLSAFEVASLVPISLFDLIIGGMVNSALVPVFSEIAEKRKDDLWGLLSTVLSLATAVLILIVILVELFTPQIAWVVGANEFTDVGLTAVAIRLMRLATPAVLFLSIASILTGALYALKRFTLPAFVGAAFNATIVASALIWRERIDSLVWGLLFGSVLQIVLQLPALRDAHLRWQFNWKHPAIRRILWLYAPIVAGLVVNQLAVAFSFNLATRLGDQSVSYMKFATTLTQFPLGLVVTAISIATLPTLSRLANGQLDAFKETLAEGIRLVMALILPATIGLFALAMPIVSLIFEHGKFSPQDTIITAKVLQVYLVGLPFAAVDQMLVFASYARKDTWRPALVGVVSIVVYSLTAVLLAPIINLFSLMAADAIKHIVHTAIMLWLLQRHLGGLTGRGVVTAVTKSLAAAVVTGLVAYGTAVWLLTPFPLTTFLHKLIVVGGAASAGLLAYILMVFLLDIREAKSLRHLLARRSA